MPNVWVRGTLLRRQGQKNLYVIRFDGKDTPSFVRPDLVLDTDVTRNGESGLFQIPEWLAANENIPEAPNLTDYGQEENEDDAEEAL